MIPVEGVKKIIAVDFDGCLCEDKYPKVGEPYWDVIKRVKEEKSQGAFIILNTSRSGMYLKVALRQCWDWGVDFDAVGEDIPQIVAAFGSGSKVAATEYWDDRARVVRSGVVRVNPEELEKACKQRIKETGQDITWSRSIKYCERLATTITNVGFVETELPQLIRQMAILECELEALKTYYDIIGDVEKQKEKYIQEMNDPKRLI